MRAAYCTKCGQQFSVRLAACPHCGAHSRGSDPSLIALDNAGNASREYLLTQSQCSVGSDPSNDLVTSEPTVSRRHALFTRTGNTCEVTDLGSTNGTHLDGRRITAPTVLRDGAEIQFGSARFLFREGKGNELSGPHAFSMLRVVGLAVKATVVALALYIATYEIIKAYDGYENAESGLRNFGGSERPATEGSPNFKVQSEGEGDHRVLSITSIDDPPVTIERLVINGRIDIARCDTSVRRVACIKNLSEINEESMRRAKVAEGQACTAAQTNPIGCSQQIKDRTVAMIKGSWVDGMGWPKSRLQRMPKTSLGVNFAILRNRPRNFGGLCVPGREGDCRVRRSSASRRSARL